MWTRLFRTKRGMIMGKNTWKIGELAKQTGITVRTLHHYHHIGLLSPSQFTESSHRLYTKDDIARLQQIISLKQLGFSLEDIKIFIENPNFNPVQVIKTQLDKVKEQIKLQEQLCVELEHIYKMLNRQQEIGTEEFIKLIEVIRINGQNYLTPEQIEKMQQLQDSFTPEEKRKMESEWTNFIKRLEDNFNKNMPVDKPEVIELAKLWKNMTSAFTGNDSELMKAAEKFHAENKQTYLQFGLTPELYRYLQSAVAKL
jgi:DNA-binding transcriptional MerR regulator